jgi:hypothetical protein
MSHLTSGQLIGLVTVFIAAELGAIGYFGLRLAAHRATDVRIIFYLLSLASLATCIGTLWAQSAGGIDSKGAFHGQRGAAINSFLELMLDLNSDCYVIGAILALIVGPQCISYALAGLFGCASAPIFVGRALSFFVWSLAKSFVTVAGIILTLALYGCAKSWNGWSALGAASMSTLSFALLLTSLFTLLIYRDIGKEITRVDPSTDRARAIRRIVGLIRAWLTRNVK